MLILYVQSYRVKILNKKKGEISVAIENNVRLCLKSYRKDCIEYKIPNFACEKKRIELGYLPR